VIFPSVTSKKTIGKIVNWIQQKVTARDADGALVGLSGGIDSSTTASLIKKSFWRRELRSITAGQRNNH